jgi:hypothetical protein
MYSIDSNKEYCITLHLVGYTWFIQVLRSPNFFSRREAGRNVKAVGEDVAVL